MICFWHIYMAIYRIFYIFNHSHDNVIRIIFAPIMLTVYSNDRDRICLDVTLLLLMLFLILWWFIRNIRVKEAAMLALATVD